MIYLIFEWNLSPQKLSAIHLTVPILFLNVSRYWRNLDSPLQRYLEHLVSELFGFMQWLFLFLEDSRAVFQFRWLFFTPPNNCCTCANKFVMGLLVLLRGDKFAPLVYTYESSWSQLLFAWLVYPPVWRWLKSPSRIVFYVNSLEHDLSMPPGTQLSSLAVRQFRMQLGIYRSLL